MKQNEFELINNYFKSLTPPVSSIEMGIGDDAAVLNIPDGYQLVTSVDTLVEGTHFLANTNAYNLGYKALAVNLSDMAAMAAEPKWFTLAISLPHHQPTWLKDFTQGLAALAIAHEISLVGGDTTKGHKTISIQIMGLVKTGQAIYRQGAKKDDDIYVSGFLGDASLALKQLLAEQLIEAALLPALETPEPRIALAQALQPYIHAMIDISDGLNADLQHLCDATQCGATVYLSKLPLSRFVQAQIKEQQLWQLPLSGGEDYELCFTASKKNRSSIQNIAEKMNLSLTRIGVITNTLDLTFIHPDGTLYTLKNKGYDHFKQYHHESL